MKTNLSSQITLTRVPKRYYQPDDVFELSRVTRFEKIPTEIFETEKGGSVYIAHEIASLIKEKNDRNEKCILGLTNGKSTLGIYHELVRLHHKEQLSFKNVVVFLLFEYYPLSNSTHGCFVQMKEMFFDKVDIFPENIYAPDGMIDKSNIIEFCKSYENKITALGGIDLQILGIGRSGNIAFNELGS